MRSNTLYAVNLDIPLRLIQSLESGHSSKLGDDCFEPFAHDAAVCMNGSLYWHPF